MEAHDKTIIDQIMLRFRPIAPKPPIDGSVSDLTPADKKFVIKKRAKRKYVKVNDNTKERFNGKVATLQLLPEVTVGNDSPSPSRGLSNHLGYRITKSEQSSMKLNTPDPVAVIPPMRVVESWVTMECVTDTCEDDGRLGCTDEEKLKNLERNTCPGFISNGVDGVQWVNLAYRRMVDPRDGGEGPPPEVVVWLEVKEKFPVQCTAFACRVRVVYTCRKKLSQTVTPCDVWRMNFGGLAWMLDVEAALSLGR